MCTTQHRGHIEREENTQNVVDVLLWPTIFAMHFKCVCVCAYPFPTEGPTKITQTCVNLNFLSVWLDIIHIILSKNA